MIDRASDTEVCIQGKVGGVRRGTWGGGVRGAKGIRKVRIERVNHTWCSRCKRNPSKGLFG